MTHIALIIIRIYFKVFSNYLYEEIRQKKILHVGLILSGINNIISKHEENSM